MQFFDPSWRFQTGVMHLNKEAVFVEMGRGSKLEPRATEEDALSTSLCLPDHLSQGLLFTAAGSLFCHFPDIDRYGKNGGY